MTISLPQETLDIISEERIQRYYNMGHSYKKALELYGINIALSKELYTPLHFLEISLR